MSNSAAPCNQLFKAILSRQLHSVQRVLEQQTIQKKYKPRKGRRRDDAENIKRQQDKEEDLTPLMVVMGVDSPWRQEFSYFQDFLLEWEARCGLTTTSTAIVVKLRRGENKPRRGKARTEFQLRCIELLLSGNNNSEGRLLSAKCRQRGWNVLHYAVMHRVDEAVLRYLLQRWRASPEDTCARVTPNDVALHRLLSPSDMDEPLPPVLLALVEENMPAFRLLLSTVVPKPSGPSSSSSSPSSVGWNGAHHLLSANMKVSLLHVICGPGFTSCAKTALKALSEYVPQYFEHWLNCWSALKAQPLRLLLSNGKDMGFYYHRKLDQCHEDSDFDHFEEVLRWLMEKGADPYLCGADGECSAHFGESCGKGHFRNLMERHSIVHKQRMQEHERLTTGQQNGLYLSLISSALMDSMGEEGAKHVVPATIGIRWMILNTNGTEAITFSINGILTKWQLYLSNEKQFPEPEQTDFAVPVQSVSRGYLKAKITKNTGKRSELNLEQSDELPLFCNDSSDNSHQLMSVCWEDLTCTLVPFYVESDASSCAATSSLSASRGYCCSSDRHWILLWQPDKNHVATLLRFDSALMRWKEQGRICTQHSLDEGQLLLDWTLMAETKHKTKEVVTVTHITPCNFVQHVATFKEEKENGKGGDKEKECKYVKKKKKLNWTKTTRPLLPVGNFHLEVINESRTKLVRYGFYQCGSLECINLQTGIQQWLLVFGDKVPSCTQYQCEDATTEYPFVHGAFIQAMLIVSLQSEPQQVKYQEQNDQTVRIKKEVEECIVLLCNGTVVMLSMNHPGHIFHSYKLPKVAALSGNGSTVKRIHPSVACLVADKNRGVVWVVGSGSPLVPLPLPSASTTYHFSSTLGDVQAFEAFCIQQEQRFLTATLSKKRPSLVCSLLSVPLLDDYISSCLPGNEELETQSAHSSLSLPSFPSLSTLCIDTLVRYLPNAALIQRMLPTDLKEQCLDYILFHTISSLQSPLLETSFVPTEPLYLQPCHFFIFLPSCGNICSLDLTGLKDNYGYLLSAIANSLNEYNNLMHINLSFAMCHVAGLASLLKRCGDQLQSLELRSACLLLDPLLTQAMSTAFEQSNHDNDRKTLNLLTVLSMHCPNLRYLGLHGQTKIVSQHSTLNILNKLPLQQASCFYDWKMLFIGCHHIEFLDLSFTNLTPYHLLYLSLLHSSLHVLILHGNTQLACNSGNTAINYLLSHCTKLQTLNLLGCYVKLSPKYILTNEEKVKLKYCKVGPFDFEEVILNNDETQSQSCLIVLSPSIYYQQTENNLWIDFETRERNEKDQEILTIHLNLIEALLI